MDYFVFKGNGDCTAGLPDGVTAAIVLSGSAEVTIAGITRPVTLLSEEAAVFGTDRIVQFCHQGDGLVFHDPELEALPFPNETRLPVDDLTTELVMEVFVRSERSSGHKHAALRLLSYQLLAMSPEAQVDDTSSAAVMAYMDRHLGEQLSLDSIAERFRCSKSTLLAKFRTESGRSPMRVLAEKRINKARLTIESTDLSITDIAHSVGYHDLASFTRFFKTQTGHSPSELRQRTRWVL